MLEKEALLCEVSWEVCNKVGGIYTVISSKAPYVKDKLKNYILIGPYFSNRHPRDFVEEPLPAELKEVFYDMKIQGIPCRYGKWLVRSEPSVILVDFSSLFIMKNDIKGKLWEWYKVDSLYAGFDFDEPVIFSIAVAKLIDAIEKKTGKKIIAHFHEWMTGGGLLWLKQNNKKVSTVFTTHATTLGRAIVSSQSGFYSNLKSIDVEKEARERGVIAKHHIEKASAQQADVFTTVSEITALEAEHILEKKADVILPNGIDFENFASLEELSIRHKELKHTIKDFIISFFFPYYSFDLDETLIFFIFGRYEFENKGLDVMIEALGKLNENLKKENSNKTIVTFFFVPTETYGIDDLVLENKTLFFDIKNYIEKNKEQIINRIIYNSVSQEKISRKNIFEGDFLDTLKKKVLRFRKKGQAPFLTHELKYAENDAILASFKSNKLLNLENDRVKVIFYPAYLNSADSLLNLEVYDAIVGGHLGIFPSAYEPWGYTPLESAALGVAAVTSDLAGFGRYIEKNVKKENPGVFVLKRFGKNKEEIVKNLFEIMKYYVSLNKEQRIENKIEARRVASLADWKKLVENYFDAYSIAYKK